MGKATYALLGVFLFVVCVNIWAQQKGAAHPDSKNQEKLPRAIIKRPKRPAVYLGHTSFCGGPISSSLFDSLMKIGLYSKDSFGHPYEILGFNFIYAERNIYEDSAGDMNMMTDYATEYCPGNVLTADLAATVYDRIKSGDTVFFEQIFMSKARTGNHIDSVRGEGFKCIITK